jgi:hypothetical protein
MKGLFCVLLLAIVGLSVADTIGCYDLLRGVLDQVSLVQDQVLSPDPCYLPAKLNRTACAALLVSGEKRKVRKNENNRSVSPSFQANATFHWNNATTILQTAVKECFNLTADCTKDVAVAIGDEQNVLGMISSAFAFCLSTNSSNIQCQSTLAQALQTVLNYEITVTDASDACILGPLGKRVRVN